LEAIDILQRVEGLTFVHFDESDVVRHHLVQRIIRAYDEHRTQVAEQQMLLLAGGKNADVRNDVRNDVKNSEAANAHERPREASGE
jgi:phosphate starvation-inducible PhoH-like protein